MAVKLDTSQDNDVRVLARIPEDATSHEVVLDFVSQFDRSETVFTQEFTQDGNWIIATINGARLPQCSGNYSLTLSDSTQDSLSWSQVLSVWSSISATWEELEGAVRNNTLATLLARVDASDFPMETKYAGIDVNQPTEYTSPDENNTQLQYSGMDETNPIEYTSGNETNETIQNTSNDNNKFSTYK